MVERVTTEDNLGTICAGHLIGGNVLLVGIANTCNMSHPLTACRS